VLIQAGGSPRGIRARLGRIQLMLMRRSITPHVPIVDREPSSIAPKQPDPNRPIVSVGVCPLSDSSAEERIG
jgi:hypothetical protein